MQSKGRIASGPQESTSPHLQYTVFPCSNQPPAVSFYKMSRTEARCQVREALKSLLLAFGPGLHLDSREAGQP